MNFKNYYIIVIVKLYLLLISVILKILFDFIVYVFLKLYYCLYGKSFIELFFD